MSNYIRVVRVSCREDSLPLLLMGPSPIDDSWKPPQGFMHVNNVGPIRRCECGPSLKIWNRLHSSLLQKVNTIHHMYFRLTGPLALVLVLYEGKSKKNKLVRGCKSTSSTLWSSNISFGIMHTKHLLHTRCGVWNEYKK